MSQDYNPLNQVNPPSQRQSLSQRQSPHQPHLQIQHSTPLPSFRDLQLPPADLSSDSNPDSGPGPGPDLAAVSRADDREIRKSLRIRFSSPLATERYANQSYISKYNSQIGMEREEELGDLHLSDPEVEDFAPMASSEWSHFSTGSIDLLPSETWKEKDDADDDCDDEKESRSENLEDPNLGNGLVRLLTPPPPPHPELQDQTKGQEYRKRKVEDSLGVPSELSLFSGQPPRTPFNSQSFQTSPPPVPPSTDSTSAREDSNDKVEAEQRILAKKPLTRKRKLDLEKLVDTRFGGAAADSLSILSEAAEAAVSEPSTQDEEVFKISGLDGDVKEAKSKSSDPKPSSTRSSARTRAKQEVTSVSLKSKKEEKKPNMGKIRSKEQWEKDLEAEMKRGKKVENSMKESVLGAQERDEQAKDLQSVLGGTEMNLFILKQSANGHHSLCRCRECAEVVMEN